MPTLQMNVNGSRTQKIGDKIGDSKENDMNLRDLLITILQDKHIGIGVVPKIADAIAADARFNIWFMTDAKEYANEEQMMELLERYEELVARCTTISRKFDENHDLTELVAGIDTLTKELTEAAKLP
jgi:hypothetical protein